ncbi:MAG: homoserine kinase [Actinomycetota bacterium]
MKVRVEVPATVANLGPGFDSVGLAVDMATVVEVELTGGQIVVENRGAWADALADAPTDETNLLARAFLAAVGGEAPEGVRFVQDLQAPVGRGFGSSAAAIVAGIVAADALGLCAPDTDLLGLAVALEGHPDNVSPCLLGGITATAGETTIRIAPPTDWVSLLAVAPAAEGTMESRTRLPDTYPRREVAGQAARAALLGFALGTGDLDALFEGTEDMMHQPTRFAALPESAQMVKEWREVGVAAFLSGAGPSIAAIVSKADAEDLADRFAASAPAGWDVRACPLRTQGARALPAEARSPTGLS